MLNKKTIRARVAVTMPPRQLEIVKSFRDPQYKYITVVCARQVGKSYAARVCSVEAALNPPFKEVSPKVAYCMPTADGAKLQYKETVALIEGLGTRNFKTNDTERTIRFHTGAFIEFLSCDQKSLSGIRGRTYDYMIIDEACFIVDEAWQVIQPFMTVANNNGRGKVLMATTAKFKNFFYRFYTSPDDDIKKIRFTAYQVPSPNIKEIQRQKEMMTDSAFAEEYLAMFVDGMNSVFKTQKIRKQSRVEVQNKKAIVAGLDWALRGDYTVLSLMNEDRQVIDYFRWQAEDLNVIIKEIIDKCEQYGRPVIYSENNGVGGHPTELLKNAYKGVVESFTTSQKSKLDIVTKMREDIVSPQDYITLINDEVLIKEFENFGQEYSKSGTVTFGNMTNETNDDIVMSLCIANFHLDKHRNASSPLISAVKINNDFNKRTYGHNRFRR